VVALQIMKVNYEQIVKAHQNQPGNAAMAVSDEVKFQVVSQSGVLSFYKSRDCERFLIIKWKTVSGYHGFPVCILQLWHECSQFYGVVGLCFQLA
jgi:hypothetical protein